MGAPYAYQSIHTFSSFDYNFSKHGLLCNSPSGKLVQIEHALTAVGSGQTSLGIKGNSRSNLNAKLLIWQ